MDKTTTHFATMGIALATQFLNQSGAPSSYTKPVRKTGEAKGGAAPAATANHRKGMEERLGAKLAPQAAICYPNSPEPASAVQRNTLRVPSASGWTDNFWDRRNNR